MQYLELIHTKQLCVVCLKFKFNEVSCIKFGKPTPTPLLCHLSDLGAFLLHVGSKDIDTRSTIGPQQKRPGEKITVSHFGAL